MDARILDHLCKIVHSLITMTRNNDEKEFESIIVAITNKMSTTKLITVLRAAFAQKYQRDS